MNKKEPRKEYKDGELNRLKKRIKKLEKENDRLKSELNSYDQAFKKTTKFLRDNTDEISLENLIQAAKNESSLKEVTEIQEKENSRNCPVCFSSIEPNYVPKVGNIILCKKCNYRTVEKE